jgi:AraC-like DNA-binding protein
VRYSARQLAAILGVQPSTISRDIKRGKLSASRDERGGYSIDSSEIARAYGDRVTIDDAGNVAATVQTQRDATPPATDATAVLVARLEAAERLLAEREQTIEDLRRRLDSEAEERRKLTARLVP